MTPPVWYCLGFAFDYGGNVLLLRKHPGRGPSSVRNRLNGLGGKIRDGESAVNAMVREFREESGIDTTPDVWRPVVQLWFASSGAVVKVFAARLLTLADARPAGEALAVFSSDTLGERPDLAPCVPWLVPLCLDAYLTGGDLSITILQGWETR